MIGAGAVAAPAVLRPARAAEDPILQGLIEQNPRTGGYRLGIVMFELGEAVRVHMDLHAAAAPVLGELRAQTGESSQVGVLDGHEVVYVDRLESTHSLRLFTETGRRVPVHCTSSGKVLLAYLPEARRHAVLRAAPLTVLTPHTITDPEQFKKFQDAQAQLSGALGRLLAVSEAYPDLKSNANFLALQSQLEGTENRIAVARSDYNAAVQAYNTRIRTFPDTITAKIIYGAKPITPFTATAPNAEAAPKVSF